MLGDFYRRLFVITRFCGDEVLVAALADKFYRNSFDPYRASKVFEVLEYLVTAGRYTIPGERDKSATRYYADPEARPRGYLRFVEWGVIALASQVNRTGHASIEERCTSGRR